MCEFATWHSVSRPFVRLRQCQNFPARELAEEKVQQDILMFKKTDSEPQRRSHKSFSERNSTHNSKAVHQLNHWLVLNYTFHRIPISYCSSEAISIHFSINLRQCIQGSNMEKQSKYKKTSPEEMTGNTACVLLHCGMGPEAKIYATRQSVSDFTRYHSRHFKKCTINYLNSELLELNAHRFIIYQNQPAFHTICTWRHENETVICQVNWTETRSHTGTVKVCQVSPNISIRAVSHCRQSLKKC